MSSKIDLNWDKLFDKYKILNEIESKGFFIISSEQINEFKESRLMTKFDHKTNLPIIFQKNNLSILPLTRGTYIIGKFEAYANVEYSDVNPIPVQKRLDLESLDYNNLYSESAVLNCAYVTGIIDDLLEEESDLTISGRMSSKNFNFSIRNFDGKTQKIDVKNSQCEIDAGFESETKIALIEAKNMKCDDFLIRQIYYPYRLWKEKVNKKVIPIFMTYSNDKFSFFIYEFDDEDDYNSLKLIKQKDYLISPEPITLEDIKETLKVKSIKESEIPFPQANNFERVVDLMGLLVSNDLSKEEITANYDFDKRQTDYYFNAGKYLGVIESYKDEQKITRVKLTSKGREIMKKNHKLKNLEIVKAIVSHKVFKETLEKYFSKSDTPSPQEVVEIMKRNTLYHIDSDSTFSRRSSTILKWIEWILSLPEES
jgi:hypothetical protein